MADHNTNTCAGCGAIIDERVTFGPLTVSLDPPQVFYKGIGQSLRAFTPRQVRILHTLARNKGKASNFGLSWAGGDRFTDDQSVKVHISSLRRRLEALGITMFIRNIPSWGYVLLFDDQRVEDRFPDLLAA